MIVEGSVQNQETPVNRPESFRQSRPKLRPTSVDNDLHNVEHLVDTNRHWTTMSLLGRATWIGRIHSDYHPYPFPPK